MFNTVDTASECSNATMALIALCRSSSSVAKQMRYERDEAGKRYFAPSEWFTHQQIRGYFEGLSVKKEIQ
jgi:hypothetical protein